MTYGILETVETPQDIKSLDLEQLKGLCAELRHYMIDCCSTNPGHLGSSLGAVELIVGLHYVYNSPDDKLVFDVGHQAYAHKILTGRRELFKHNRQRNGISGFPKRSESKYDAFGAGHSSTSISAALGFAEAAKMQNLPNKAIALIGDGALTGGLAFEGLNNAGALKSDLLVILNDNNISIDDNIGALHEYLLQITTNPKYNNAKKLVWDKLGDSGFRKYLQKLVGNVKSNLVSSSGGNLFQAMGFRYFGPIDGNDLEQVIQTLSKIRDLEGPILLHTITKKGKGFAPAEENQTVWHAPGMFDPETGERVKNEEGVSRYQDVFGDVLVDLAKRNPKVVAITPAMASGCGLNRFASELPDRFYDVGIEEEHAVTFSAGLAAGGMKPFCNIYSSFSQRAYDQIIHDVAMQNLPVVMCLDRGGLVGEDGFTHHGCFDMAVYRTIPNAIIAAPKDESELKNLMYTAMEAEGGPFIIRYPRGYGEGVEWTGNEYIHLEPGKGECLLEGTKVALICAGPVANRAKEAAMAIADKQGWNPAVYDIRYIKPIDTEILRHVSENFEAVVTIEDGCIAGGLHGAVAEFMVAQDAPIKVEAIGVPDKYIDQGTQEELRDECGLTTDKIVLAVQHITENKTNKY